MSIMTVTQYAKYRNVSKTMIYEYLKDGAISKDCVTNQNPLEFDVNLADACLEAATAGGKEVDESTLLFQKIRLTKINADRKELELEKARGELIDTAFAQKMWAGVLENIIKKIDIIPSKLPPLAYGLSIAEIKAVTERMIFEVKNEMSNPDLEQIARNISNKGAAKFNATKTDTKRKRVGGQKSDAKSRSKRGAREMVHSES